MLLLNIFNAYGSSSTASGNGDPLSDTETEAILTFRTITTLLAMVQKRPQPYTLDHEDLETTDIEKRMELKILNALATVLVMDREVVAVVTKYRSENGSFGIIASQQSADSSPSGSFLQQFFINMNPREDIMTQIKSLSLDDPKPPAELQGPVDSDNPEALITYVHERR